MLLLFHVPTVVMAGLLLRIHGFATPSRIVPSSFRNMCSRYFHVTGFLPSSSSSYSPSRSCAFSSSSVNVNDDVVVDVDSFQALDTTINKSVHPVLLKRLAALGLTQPTAVQAASFHAFLSGKDLTIGSETGSGKTYAYLLPLINDILHQRERQQQNDNTAGFHYDYGYARAIILVPNKELVNQVVRMALPLAGGPEALLSSSSTVSSSSSSSSSSSTSRTPKQQQLETSVRNDDDGEPNGSSATTIDTLVRLAVFPGGLNEPTDFRPFREALAGSSPPPDIVVSTPAILAPFGSKPKHIDMFADIQTLVVDEADMCVDGGYIRAVEQVLLGFRRADRLVMTSAENDNDRDNDGNRLNNNNNNGKDDATTTSITSVSSSSSSFHRTQKTQHVFVAATLPDYGLRSVNTWLNKKFPYAHNIRLNDMHRARHSGLTHKTEWIPLEGKRERMQKLIELLKKNDEHENLSNEKVMVFCNSVEDVEGVTQALQRADIGVNAVAYHAKQSLQDRTSALERFRRYEPRRNQRQRQRKQNKQQHEEEENKDEDMVVLVCSDLASRGLDIANVTAVVQLQFAGNVVAHLHRMGRCGRRTSTTGAGSDGGGGGGRGIVFYSAQERELVQVLQQAEREQERMRLPGDVATTHDEEEEDGFANAASSSLKEDEVGRGGEEDANDELLGTVKNAFSRKRGFTKKRKKLMRSKET